MVKNAPKMPEGEITHWLVRNEKQNKSTAFDTERKDGQKAILSFRIVAKSDTYYLLEIDLQTGRHHQIRSQLSKIGSPIKGDLKYGAERSNPDGGISLHARHISFVHPVSKEVIQITAPVPDDKLWQAMERLAK
jgi:23S rRNA pseudouridine1911/1915/1917 synthase